MSVLEDGYYYYFLRPSGANGLGHMGWGFRSAEGLWVFGSLENTSGQPFVDAGGDQPCGSNGYWWTEATTEDLMRREMRTMEYASERCGIPMTGYEYFKRIPVPDAKPDEAQRVAMRQSGYGVVGNNCLDNAAIIGDAYGVPVWSWSRHLAWMAFVPGGGWLAAANFSPNAYFYETLWQYPHQPV